MCVGYTLAQVLELVGVGGYNHVCVRECVCAPVFTNVRDYCTVTNERKRDCCIYHIISYTCKILKIYADHLDNGFVSVCSF